MSNKGVADNIAWNKATNELVYVMWAKKDLNISYGIYEKYILNNRIYSITESENS